MSLWGVWEREAGTAILTSSAGFSGLVCVCAGMLWYIYRHMVGFRGVLYRAGRGTLIIFVGPFQRKILCDSMILLLWLCLCGPDLGMMVGVPILLFHCLTLL